MVQEKIFYGTGHGIGASNQCYQYQLSNQPDLAGQTCRSDCSDKRLWSGLRSGI